MAGGSRYASCSLEDRALRHVASDEGFQTSRVRVSSLPSNLRARGGYPLESRTLSTLGYPTRTSGAGPEPIPFSIWSSASS